MLSGSGITFILFLEPFHCSAQVTKSSIPFETFAGQKLTNGIIVVETYSFFLAELFFTLSIFIITFVLVAFPVHVHCKCKEISSDESAKVGILKREW